MINVFRMKFILILLLLFSCTSKSTLLDKDVGLYNGIKHLGHGPIFIKRGEFAFVAQRSFVTNMVNEIQLLDLKDIDKPKLHSVIDLGKNIQTIHDFKVYEEEKKLIVTASFPYPPGGSVLKVFDISDLKNIVLIEEVKMRATALGHAANSQYFYVSGSTEEYGATRIMLFKIEDKLQPIKSFEWDGYNLVISPDKKKMVFVGRENKLILVDISDPLSMMFLDADSSSFNNRMNLAPSGNPLEMVFSDDSQTLYVASGAPGLLVYDIAHNKLDKIQQTSSFYWKYGVNQTGAVSSVAIHGDQLYLSGQSKLPRKDLSFVKGFDQAVLFRGANLKVSPDGSFLIYQSAKVNPNALIIKRLTHKL